MKKSSKKDTINFYDDVYRKIRKTWGDVDPRTKVLQSKKKYNRKKEKHKWKKEIDD